MLSHMLHHVPLLRESFGTELASELFDIEVSFQMDDEVLRLGELLHAVEMHAIVEHYRLTILYTHF